MSASRVTAVVHGVEHEALVTESVIALTVTIQVSWYRKKWLLTCRLFKFGCSRSLPLYIASKSVLHTQYDVK